jgi:DNA-binding CsgD family transcriptional regulator
MKCFTFSLIAFIFLATQPALCQSEESNTFFSQHEKTIRQTFKTLSSEQQLTLKDTFTLYRTLARNLFDIGDFETALTYAKKSTFIAPRIGKRKTPNYLFLLHYFNATEAYDSSIYYMKIVVDTIVQNQKASDTYLLAKTYNNIGFTYYLNRQLDSAQHYYQKTLHIDSLEEKYSDIFGLATGNLGQVFFKKGDYKQALVNMETDAKLTKNKIWESYNNALIGISKCHYEMNNLLQAKETLDLYFSQKKQGNKAQLIAYKFAAKVHEKLNASKQSAIYLRKYIFLNDSLRAHKKPNKALIQELSEARVYIIERDLTLTQNKVELMNASLVLAKTKDKVQEFKIIALILLLIALIIAFIFIKSRQKKSQAIQLLQKELLESELKNKKTDLNNVVTNLTYKRKFIDEIQNKLKNLQTEPEESLQKNLTLLIREFNTYKSADKNTEVLQSDIDKVNLSFFKKLTEKYPLLTANEKEMCGLFALNLSTKDIAIVRNITPNAVKKARQRIRRKLPISTEEKLTTFFSES